MYCRPSFPSKAALKRALAAGERVTVFSPGFFPAPTEGSTVIEGPAYKPHTWYAQVEISGGVITKVKA